MRKRMLMRKSGRNSRAINTSGGGVSDPKAISDIGHLRQLLDIIKAVDNGHPPSIDGMEARKAVELVLAIYASAKNKRIVYL